MLFNNINISVGDLLRWSDNPLVSPHTAEIMQITKKHIILENHKARFKMSRTKTNFDILEKVS